MAKVDITDIPSFYLNPHLHSQVENETKKTKGREVSRRGKTDFSRIYNDARDKATDELGPLRDLPVSTETVEFLMDEVRSTGDALQSRPFPEEIMRYKQAVRNFMHYVVKNSYALEHEVGIRKYLKPGFSGQKGTPDAMSQKQYTKIQVIDKKLEDLAAALVSSQMPQLGLAARLEEISGLLVDLLQ